jgi:hypothetical protein
LNSLFCESTQKTQSDYARRLLSRPNRPHQPSYSPRISHRATSPLTKLTADGSIGPGISLMQQPENDIIGPLAIWNRLTQDDQTEYLRLRLELHQTKRPGRTQHRLVTFYKELLTVLSFIERRPEGIEERSIISGAAFAGTYICLNTRQLKAFTGRCKASINGSFLDIGYTGLLARSKTRSCVLACLPSLDDHYVNLRQWRVRCASSAAKFCFCSSFTGLEKPVLCEKDIEPPRNPGVEGFPKGPEFKSWSPKAEGLAASGTEKGTEAGKRWDLSAGCLGSGLRREERSNLLYVFDDCRRK